MTTDTAAALRAAEIDAEALLKATKVDGIFDCDPITNTNAKLHRKLSFRQVMLKDLRVMDETAITLCKENNIKASSLARPLFHASHEDMQSALVVGIVGFYAINFVVQLSTTFQPSLSLPMLQVVVFNLSTPGNIMRALVGDSSIGTTVSGCMESTAEKEEWSADWSSAQQRSPDLKSREPLPH